MGSVFAGVLWNTWCFATLAGSSLSSFWICFCIGFRCPNVPELYMRVSLLLRTNQASHVVPPMPLAVPYSEKSVFASWCQESSLPQGFGRLAGWEWEASVVIFPFKMDASLHSVPSTLIMGHGVYLKIMSCQDGWSENLVPKLRPFPMVYIK